jgi:hypothetical protein
VETTTSGPVGRSPALIGARADLEGSADLGGLAEFGDVAFRMRQGRRHLWVVATVGGRDACALCAGFSADDLVFGEQSTAPDGTLTCEFASSLGAMRAKIAFPSEGHATVRCTTSLLPARDVVVSWWPRDLYPLANEGTVHTSQRGLRSGIVFASTEEPAQFSLFYLQDFSSLNDYFAQTKRSPADSVGGRWPELGYAPPGGEDAVLRKAREVVVSDAYLTLTERVPETDGDAAAQYLDMLADLYLSLPRPETTYHDWPDRAARALRDLTFSPACTYVRDGRRYLMPYAGDEEKPPESMVQLTLAVNTGEYERWRGEPSAFGTAMRATAPSFFDDEVGSVVRWLPGADFGASQAEENMNHEAMDSWYLHHSLFNLSRLASEGDEAAKELFRRSLPFAIRVARRFAYRWPVFFNLRNLDVVRAESEPGRGGETDVGGLYALVMLHALELFGDDEYLAEAKRGAESLRGLGFELGYQLNTTGFAAEAALRLWKLTHEREYLELSEICMANLFDNMWLWQCDYERARHYRSFFGLFPLRDAPYLAAYEELEAQGKFHEYLQLGGEDVRPSLRLLLAEYQKYALDRGWYYYPDALPADVLAEKSRNGRIERALSVPLEDLQDGREPSGQVGQELYGAGMPFVFTSRHYARVASANCWVYCNYPMYDFTSDVRAGETVAGWRAGGDPRCSCELRVIPLDANAPPAAVTVTVRAGEVRVPLRGTISAEGHAVFELRGGQQAEIRWRGTGSDDAHAITVGALPR